MVTVAAGPVELNVAHTSSDGVELNGGNGCSYITVTLHLVCSQEREALGESECSDAIFQLRARVHAVCLNVSIKKIRGRGKKACGLEMLCQCFSAGLSVWCVVAVCV